MSKKDAIVLKGVVKKRLPSAKFLVETENNNSEVICSLSGKLRQNKIKISEHDRVELEISIYDLKNGRITWRL